jgi:hypothetical protein
MRPPPTLRERRHRGLARRRVAMRRRAIFVIVENQHPHPRAKIIGLRRSGTPLGLEQHRLVP